MSSRCLSFSHIHSPSRLFPLSLFLHRLSAELAEARRQADQRVSGIVEKCKEKEDRLMLELRSVELACAEQEDKRARAAREKQAAESALSKLSAAIQAEQDELRNKLTATQSMVRECALM